MDDERKKISRGRRKELLTRLKSLVKPKMSLIYLAAALSWIQFLMRIASFTLIAWALAEFYQGKAVEIGWLLFALAAFTLCGFLISLLAKRLQGLASQYARDSLKESFFHTFSRHQGDLNGTRAADILTVASQGIDSLDTYYSYYLSLNLRTYFNCATVLVIMLFLFPLGALIFLVSLPLIPVSIILMQKRSQKIMNRYWASYMDVGNLFLDDLKGLNTLYSYQADQVYEKEFAEQAEDFRDATMELLGFQLQSVGYMDGVMYLGIGIAGFVSALLLAGGNISLFTGLYFILIATEFFTPIREAGYGMHLVMMTTKMADRIFQFLDSAQGEEGSGKADIHPFDSLEVSKLNFAYQDRPIFTDLSFAVKKGEIFALAGESGRGKTTLANLLLGKLSYQSGSIRFGEQELSQLSQDSCYKEVVYVSSDNVLLNTTILENLQLAGDYSAQEIQTWLEEKGVLGFVKNLADGLQTVVGENGNRLSPGQRQQVICVRAMLAKASLYLFDEMTSSVDSENEAVIHHLMELMSQEAIVIEITHKMKQVMKADRVLFIGQNGVTIASPYELYAHNTDYRTLADTQERLEELLYAE